jgi:hypothetical protein
MYSATETNIFKNDVAVAKITKYPNFNIYCWDFINEIERREWYKFYYSNFYKWFDSEKFPFCITIDEFLYALITNQEMFNNFISKENPKEYFIWKNNFKQNTKEEIIILEHERDECQRKLEINHEYYSQEISRLEECLKNFALLDEV